jgi:tRNA(fMet)-specific endonuclease VapC
MWTGRVSGLVVDTSVWIDFFAGVPARMLEDGLAQGAVVLPPIVVAELVSGAREGRQRALIFGLLRDLPVHETPLEHWVLVGDLRRSLAEKGVAVSTPDAHVAQCAIDRDALLLSRDDVFKRIARRSALRLAAG